MFKFIVIFASILVISSFPFQPLYKFKKTIITTTTTTTMSPTHSQQPKTTLHDITEFLKAVHPLLILFISIFISVLGYFSRKCYQNEGRCKIAWFKIKSPAEYGRRQQINRQRQIILDQLIVQPSSNSILS